MRKNRNGLTKGKYHIINRTNSGEYLFNDVAIQRLFLTTLKECQDKFHFVIHNFCIMGNHIHLLLDFPDSQENSKALGWLFGVFALRYNKLTKNKGHFWRQRFSSRHIESETYYRCCFIYILENPIRAGIANSPVDHWPNGINFGLPSDRYPMIEPDHWILQNHINPIKSGEYNCFKHNGEPLSKTYFYTL